jgi:tetratricopeptide (TPR) repeat protein
MLLSPSRCLIVLALSGACIAPTLSATGLNAQVLTVPTQTAKQPAPQPPNPDAQIDPQAAQNVIASLQAKDFDDALTGAKAIVAANPDSPRANKLVGVVLLDRQEPADALPYFQKALQLSPSDPTINALLLQVYAQTGDKTHRDEQRAILHGYHSDGKHPAFAQMTAYLIETLPVGDKTIQAIEFYEPSGQFHFYYRFNVFDSAGKIQSFIALESDDADQALYAQQHPKEAAAGERRFSVDGYSQNADGHLNQALFNFYDGQPSYDDVRALVVKLVQTGRALALATTTAPATPAK